MQRTYLFEDNFEGLIYSAQSEQYDRSLNEKQTNYQLHKIERT